MNVNINKAIGNFSLLRNQHHSDHIAHEIAHDCGQNPEEREFGSGEEPVLAD
jgi:hypothetical protein